ncbi:hypothetical protein SOV_37080 [Sporomusa ovata DSM 2662]|uniref:Uncharacterized protein n=1 Tax=Sporomusa ovata TaxID=2378 RepID=A0A0U1L694_9FIRM|nr:hypothetical protein [Sporomusa ovata]EQB24857.1 hypothetical protein SOV_6c02710 [Sporomusa ovata DSM 2662]CQR75207.1 hypothetical protein SpAn4DRAFT_4571 [Sporomusa ovata]
MRKTLFAFLMATMIAGLSSGMCFAKDGDEPRAYPEKQVPVTYDREYPEWGFRTHSWITGTGKETIAHTQLIDMTHGIVIKEVSHRCSYTDPVYNHFGNK